MALGPVSRKSRNFTGHFRVSQFPLDHKNGEDLRRQNLTVSLLFVTLKTCLKIGFPEQAVGRFTNGFSGPKSFWDFRETGPWSLFRICERTNRRRTEMKEMAWKHFSFSFELFAISNSDEKRKYCEKNKKYRVKVRKKLSKMEPVINLTIYNVACTTKLIGNSKEILRHQSAQVQTQTDTWSKRHTKIPSK